MIVVKYNQIKKMVTQKQTDEDLTLILTGKKTLQGEDLANEQAKDNSEKVRKEIFNAD